MVLPTPAEMTPMSAPAAPQPLCATLWPCQASRRISLYSITALVCCFLTRLSPQSLPRYTSCRYSNSYHLATVCPSLPSCFLCQDNFIHTLSVLGHSHHTVGPILYPCGFSIHSTHYTSHPNSRQFLTKEMW